MTGISVHLCNLRKLSQRQGWQAVPRRGGVLLPMSQGVPTREWGDQGWVNEIINTLPAGAIPYTDLVILVFKSLTYVCYA